VKPCAEEVV